MSKNLKKCKNDMLNKRNLGTYLYRLNSDFFNENLR